MRAPVALAVSLLSPFATNSAAQIAQESVDLRVVERIREEGLERSQIEDLARHLTEVVGPRLTGSPGMAAANAWTQEKFDEWGLANTTLEAWGDFGRGWRNEWYAGRILTPFSQPLRGMPLAWTGSTDGSQRGQATVVRAETEADLAAYRGRLAGTFVLIDEPAEVEPEFEHRDRRASLESLLEPAPSAQNTQTEAERQATFARFRAAAQLRNTVQEMAAEEGAHGIIRISSRDDGVVRGGSAGSRTPGDPEGLPHIALSREQYNQIWRNVEAGVPVELQVDVVNTFFEDDPREYNSFAEITGSDKANELVMLGAHLDSWHMGGGATDNGAGSVIMMEAMRILKTLDLRPRRTIRIGLWSGEEQGLLGSRNWVANHPELHDRISVYVNIDNGTGRLRGIWNQSNPAAIPVFEQLLWPFRDLGVVAVRDGNTGGTDHLAFDAAGIPGFNFIQDPIEYGINTHHTELDTFDHLVIDDLRQAAMIVAATVYHLAMREEMMPRKSEQPIS